MTLYLAANSSHKTLAAYVQVHAAAVCNENEAQVEK